MDKAESLLRELSRLVDWYIDSGEARPAQAAPDGEPVFGSRLLNLATFNRLKVAPHLIALDDERLRTHKATLIERMFRGQV